MKLSLNWLRRYVDIPVPAEELCDKMVMNGFEVEEIIDLSACMKNVVVGKILSLDKHPDADKLQICQLDVGAGEPVRIGGDGPGKLFFLGLAALDHGDRQFVLYEIGVDMEHPLGLFHSLRGSFVHRMPFLPEKFRRAQEGARRLFPADDIGPLVVELGQIAVGAYNVGVVLAEKRFRGRAYAETLA